MNRLRQMSIFAHIVEAGSISRAASNLDLSKSVISQHLKALETDLAITLLKRTTRRQTLTTAGKNFYEHCKSLNDIANTAWQNAQESLEIPRGRVRITAPNALIETLISPVIGKLIKQYPLLEPELIASDDRLDIHEHNIDLAIRVGHLPDSNLVQKRIGCFRDILCVSPQLNTTINVNDYPYIANAWQGKHISHTLESVHLPDIQFTKEARCITNSFYSCLSLIKSGVGIGIVPDFHFQQLEPTLQQAFPEHFLPLNQVYALTAYGKHTPLSTSICIDAIKQQFSQLPN